MFRFKRLIWLICLASPYSVIAAECEPSAELTQDEMAKHHYVRPQAASCTLLQDTGSRPMWKLIENSGNAWPYEYAGQCSPAKGRSFNTYGCIAAEGCAIFVGKNKLRVHLRKADLECQAGAEP